MEVAFCRAQPVDAVVRECLWQSSVGDTLGMNFFETNQIEKYEKANFDAWRRFVGDSGGGVWRRHIRQ
ncbi:hypothetical protein [Trinickia dinghuensis]|uniref:hypothetical protein n=1 Tax=Trinickia dinghuensis TaxID=2291023 RepID=UPI0011C02AC4|nr:hypothetical protein [Trinickia dinghuensis]